MRKPSLSDQMDAARADLAAIATPRTHAEWRRASTALRRARRIARALKQAWTPRVDCGGSHRYLSAWTHGDTTDCYNGAAGLGSLRIVRHHAQMYRQGSWVGRLSDAHYFAAACRREGPVPLPDLRWRAGEVERLAA
jgi:hypothetical protein